MNARSRVWALPIALACLGAMAVSAQARQGFYIGIGGAEQSVKGGLDGTHGYQDPSGHPIFYDGKLDSGSVGLAATIGYGLNRYFALEYLYADTLHKAKSETAGKSSDAEFASQVYGARLTAPFSERVEGFLRAGYGVYDVTYKDFAIPAAGGTQPVVFHGTGTALGAGLEFMFQELGVGFGYTQHSYTVDRAKPDGGKELSLKKDLTGTATTTDVMFTYHF